MVVFHGAVSRMYWEKCIKFPRLTMPQVEADGVCSLGVE